MWKPLYASGRGLEPADITDDTIGHFSDYLREEAMVATWEQVQRTSIRAWNRLAGAVSAGVHLSHLSSPAPKRTPYWIAKEDWPAPLRDEVEALIDQLAKPNLFKGHKVRKIKPATAEQYGHMISTLVSAAVGGGVNLGDLKRLMDAIAPDCVAIALTFLAARGGDRITATMIQMMVRVRVIADMVGLPTEQRAELEEMFANLQANSDRPKRSMAPKNRALLERLENDQRFSDLIQTLPARLASEARARADSQRLAPSLMPTALAIDLLLTCSMRRENLVSLELGKSIKRAGKAPSQFWVIEIVAEDVKNSEPLRYRLAGSLADLLEEYLADWRTRLCALPNAWLFPNSDGGMMDPKTLAASIQRQSGRILGVAISPHQFRHISAEAFLLENPDKLQLISEHLGHRDPNTTRTYYARPKQKQASKAYQDHVLQGRKNAEQRLESHGRRPRRSTQGDGK